MDVPDIPPPGRGRPLGFDRDAALDAAMAVFWDLGYAAASVPLVSQRTGLSASSLYNTFGSKLDLFTLALDRYLDGVIDGMMVGPMTRGDAGLADVEAYLARLEDTIELEPSRGCLAINTLAELRDPPPAVAARTRRYRDDLATGLRAALTRAASAGEIAPDGVEERVAAIGGIAIAFNLLLAARVPHDESRAVIRSARALL